MDQVCFYCSWVLAEKKKKKKKDAFKKWSHEKESSLFHSCSPSFPGSPVFPPCLLLHFTCLSAEFSLLQCLGDSWHLNRISDLGALWPAAKISPSCQHLATHLREARTSQMLLYSRKISAIPAGCRRDGCENQPAKASDKMGYLEDPSSLGLARKYCKYKKTTQAWLSRDWAKIFLQRELIFVKQVIEKEKLFSAPFQRPSCGQFHTTPDFFPPTS